MFLDHQPPRSLQTYAGIPRPAIVHPAEKPPPVGPVPKVPAYPPEPPAFPIGPNAVPPDAAHIIQGHIGRKFKHHRRHQRR